MSVACCSGGMRLRQWGNRIGALLTACAVFSAMLCSCMPAPQGPQDEGPTTLPVLPTAPQNQQAKDTLTLPFANRDVLNPYAAVTELNQGLSPLLYEGLFACDARYEAQPVLAAGIEQVNPTLWTIALREDRVFHNGSPVTMDDVLYSFGKARASAYYKTRLENISNLRVKDGALEMTLRRANQYTAACLDFPVVPAGSAEKGRLPQAKNGLLFTKASTPPGTGRYQLANRDGAFVLEYDSRHPGPPPRLTTIALYGVNNDKALLYGLEMGSYQFAYDNLSAGEAPRVNAGAARVPTTNLLYLGFNSGRAGLQDPALRGALAACVNKTAVLSDAWHGYADATDTPFPQAWHGVHPEDFARPYDAAAARKGLEDLGYNMLRDGLRASKYRKLSFTLLTLKSGPKRAAAKAVQSQLKAFQIEVILKALPKADYLAAVRAGAFDLYVGEIRLTPDLNLSPLLMSGGAASKGVQVWGKASSAYGQLLQGLIPPAKFVSIFLEDLPFLPLGYRYGMAASARSLKTVGMRQGDLFAGICEWEV